MYGRFVCTIILEKYQWGLNAKILKSIFDKAYRKAMSKNYIISDQSLLINSKERNGFRKDMNNGTWTTYNILVYFV